MPGLSTRWMLIGVVAAGLLSGVAVLFVPRPVQVDVAKVSVGPIAETVQDQGVVRVREAYVVSAPVSGRLERLDLHVGDHVTADRTVLARMRPAPPDLLDPRARAQATAAVAAAGAAVSAARATEQRLAAEARRADLALERTRILSGKGFAPKRALDDAEADARAAHAAEDAAAADVAARQAQLVSARSALMGPGSSTREIVPVTSPATGYVTRVLQESERTVAIGAPLVEISENAGLEAQIEFLSQDAVRIREGMPAEIYDWGGAGVIAARVRRVEPEGYLKISALGVEEHRVLVMLQFEGAADRWTRLAPGYGVWGRVFLRQEPKAVKVPLGALVGLGEGWSVFRLDHGHARLVPVSVGAMTDREAEIRRGLSPGDTVVLFPSDRVKDGGRISVRKGAA